MSDNLYAYTELTDEAGVVINRAKLLCRDGIYAGYLDIPSSADGGRYRVHSYTKHSLNPLDSASVPACCPLVMETDQTAYTLAAPVMLKLSLPDLHEAETADISISVTAGMPTGGHQPSSIIAAFPASCGQASAPVGPVLADTTQTLVGHVVSLMLRRPEAQARVSLIAPKLGFFATTTTGDDGRFCFSGLDFPEGTQYLLRATRHNGRDDVELRIDEEQYPDWSEMPDFAATDIYISGAPDTTSTFIADGILLDGVEVAGTKCNSASRGDVYAQSADFSFGFNKIEEIGATCLHELIRHIPGVRLHQNYCYIRAKASIYGDTPAAIAIDGIIVPDDYDLDNIQMQDVARVDVFKTGTTVIWGSAGGSGVISITTKVGNYGETPVSKNQKQVTPLGFQRKARFHSLSDQRKTLYWNPNVTSDTIQLNAGMTPGRCHIVIEGVTTEGRLIHEESDIIVKE